MLILDTKLSQTFFSNIFLINTLIVTLLSLLIYVLLNLKRKNEPPGPAPWPLLGNLPHLDFLPYRKMAKLAQKYGPLMRLYFGSQFTIIVSSSELAKEILQKHDKSTASRMPTITGKIFSNGERDIIMSPYGPYWRKVRKIANLHLLTQKSLHSWKPKRIEAVMRVADIFAEEAKSNNGLVEVRRILNQASLNIVMAMVAGKFYRFANAGDPPQIGDQLTNLVQQVLTCMSDFNLADYVPLLSPFDLQGVEKRAIIVKKQFELYATSLIDERIEQRSLKSIESVGSEKDHDSKDFLDVLLDLQEEEELTKMDIRAVIQDMFLAGIESSSLTSEWALAELIKHPEQMEKLRKELKDVEISADTDFSKLLYLQAVIKESYRHHNSLPLLVPRKTQDNIEIKGYTIPKNSAIFINAWAIFHDPKIWSEPMEYRPERFLEEEIDHRGNDFRFIPFGAGRRICPGMNLGHSTVEIMLSILVKRFVWTLPPGESRVDLSEKFKLSMVMAKPLWAHIDEAQG